MWKYRHLIRKRDKVIAIQQSLPIATKRFSFLKSLGRGHLGETWQVQDIGSGKWLAAKVLEIKPDTSDELKAELQNELSMLRMLGRPGHPNLIGLHYELPTEDKHYVVMVIEE